MKEILDNKLDQGASCSCSQLLQECTSSCCCGTCNDSEIMEATGVISFRNRLDHILARLGWNRMGHTVLPGLYRLGNPDADSPVLASANYTLSFDALRSALDGIDAWILVLDTNGINVWCAAGKGTFGTEELIRSIEMTGLAGIVRHRKIIAPQLGAPGISWPEVVRRTKFRVEYGPVRARDLTEYIRTGTATPEMRRVRFTFRDRIVLTPVEFNHVALPMIATAVILYFLAGPLAGGAAVAAVLAGTVLFPALLPFIPTKDFSTKGFILGAVVAIPFAVSFGSVPAFPAWATILGALVPLLIFPAVVGYLGLNFTGCTTFTSRTGVRNEIFRYVPSMAMMAVFGTILGIILGVSRILGVI